VKRIALGDMDSVQKIKFFDVSFVLAPYIPRFSDADFE
jgi:hypothetical protein